MINSPHIHCGIESNIEMLNKEYDRLHQENIRLNQLVTIQQNMITQLTKPLQAKIDSPTATNLLPAKQKDETKSPAQSNDNMSQVVSETAKKVVIGFCEWFTQEQQQKVQAAPASTKTNMTQSNIRHENYYIDGNRIIHRHNHNNIRDAISALETQSQSTDKQKTRKKTFSEHIASKKNN